MHFFTVVPSANPHPQQQESIYENMEDDEYINMTNYKACDTGARAFDDYVCMNPSPVSTTDLMKETSRTKAKPRFSFIENSAESDHDYINTVRTRHSFYEETDISYVNIGQDFSEQPQYINTSRNVSSNTQEPDGQYYENVRKSSATSKPEFGIHSTNSHTSTSDAISKFNIYDTIGGYPIPSEEYSVVVQELRKKFSGDQLSSLTQMLQKLQVRSGSATTPAKDLSYLVSMTTKILAKL